MNIPLITQTHLHFSNAQLYTPGRSGLQVVIDYNDLLAWAVPHCSQPIGTCRVVSTQPHLLPGLLTSIPCSSLTTSHNGGCNTGWIMSLPCCQLLPQLIHMFLQLFLDVEQLLVADVHWLLQERKWCEVLDKTSWYHIIRFESLAASFQTNFKSVDYIFLPENVILYFIWNFHS